MWMLKSPGEKLKILVGQKEDGSLCYQIKKGGKTRIRKSRLGIYTDLGSFEKDLLFEDVEYRSIQEEYSIPAGKKSVYENSAREMALRFTAQGAAFTLRVRAFDNGAAFRYEIDAPGRPELMVEKEVTEFRFGKSYESMWLQDWVPTYEDPYNPRGWDKSINGQIFGMPSLFYSDRDSSWVMINEANVLNTNGSYCSCHLVGDEHRRMTIGFAPEEKGNPIKTPLPFYSPWRYVVAADDLNELVNSTVNYNLNPPSVIDDTSWITPGRALWSWWQDMNGAQLYMESRDYVDMAAAYGFEALTLDCGWDPCWIEELCAYAHEKNVKIWAWTPMQRLDTVEKAEKLIPLWASWGIDGLKIDFFENDSQHTMWQYHMIADLARENRLMINYHGSVKPMGEGRTWPHFLTAEGIMGMEHYQWSNLPDSRHNCTVPFTRNVAGPMDYTPTAFSNRSNKNTTMGHQLALPVVFDSGVTNYALTLRYMESWKGTDFLRRTKAHYDGVRVLSGYPGDHAAILRWTDSEWLIGVITVLKKEIYLPMDFLGEGEYEAEIYEDSFNGEMISVRSQKVTAGDTLELRLLQNGGAGVYITRKPGALPEGICSGYMSKRYTELLCADAGLHGGSEKIQWDHTTGGVVLNGSMTLHTAVEKSGNYSLRLFYAAEEDWEMEADVGSDVIVEKMPASGAMRTFLTHTVIVSAAAGDLPIRIRRLRGKAPAIWKAKLIDNNPFRPLLYGVSEENLTGGGEIIFEDGIPTACGLGGDTELLFTDVEAGWDGRYVLRILYSAGDNRDISIQANDDKPIHTYLHNTAGWGFPSWETAGEKEVTVDLKKGKNWIRFYNDHGLMSHIRGFELDCVAGGLPGKK